MSSHAQNYLGRHPRYYLTLGFLMAVVLLTAGVLFSVTQRIDESQDVRRSAQYVADNPRLAVTNVEAEANKIAVVPITVKNFKDVTAADITVVFSGQKVSVLPNDIHSNIPGVVVNKREVVERNGNAAVRYQVTHTAGITLPDNTILFSAHVIPSKQGTVSVSVDTLVSQMYTKSSGAKNVLAGVTPGTMSVIEAREGNTPSCGFPSILVPPGIAPYEQFLYPGGSFPVNYSVDFEGTGNWQTRDFDSSFYTYANPGVYNPKFIVLGQNGRSVVCNYPFSVLVYQNQNQLPTGPMDRYEAVSATSRAVDAPGADDDLYIANVQETFYEGNTQIKSNTLEVGKQYRYRITARLVNTKRVPNSTDNRSITVRLDANNSGSATFTASYGELLRSNGGLAFTLESPFVATNKTKIETLADSGKVITEYNEQNNDYQIDIVLDKDDDDSDNTSSTATFANTCNKYCADTTECGFGLTCQNNQCRHPGNVNNTSCAGLGSSVAGCNIACNSSADCAAGLYCASGSCRNPSNISSATCAARSSTSTGVGGPSKGNGSGSATTVATPAPTATPRPTATPQPSASPLPTIPAYPATGSGSLDASASAPILDIPETLEPPPVSADTTVSDDITAWLTNLGLPTDLNLGGLLIGAGIGLLLLILLIAIISSRSRRTTNLQPIPATKPATSFTPMPGVLKGSATSPTTPPPSQPTTLPANKNAGVTLLPGQSPQSTPQTVSATGTKGVTPEQKSPIPQAPQASSAQSSSSSMVQRLQEKGITLDKQ